MVPNIWFASIGTSIPGKSTTATFSKINPLNITNMAHNPNLQTLAILLQAPELNTWTQEEADQINNLPPLDHYTTGSAPRQFIYDEDEGLIWQYSPPVPLRVHHPQLHWRHHGHRTWLRYCLCYFPHHAFCATHLMVNSRHYLSHFTYRRRYLRRLPSRQSCHQRPYHLPQSLPLNFTNKNISPKGDIF